MRVRAQEGEEALLTVVETEYGSKGKFRKRWVILDQRGRQSSTTYEMLGTALKHAAYSMLAWHLWLEDGNTFCR